MRTLAQVNLDELINETAPNFGSNKLGTDPTLAIVIEKIIPYFFFFAGGLLVLYIVMGGIAMMTSRGDPKALGTAKAKISNGLLGFVIVFTAYWIVQLVGLFLGLGAISGVFK